MSETAFADSISRFTSDPSAGRITPSVTATLANNRARLSAGPNCRWSRRVEFAVTQARQFLDGPHANIFPTG